MRSTTGPTSRRRIPSRRMRLSILKSARTRRLYTYRQLLWAIVSPPNLPSPLSLRSGTPPSSWSGLIPQVAALALDNTSNKNTLIGNPKTHQDRALLPFRLPCCWFPVRTACRVGHFPPAVRSKRRGKQRQKTQTCRPIPHQRAIMSAVYEEGEPEVVGLIVGLFPVDRNRGQQSQAGPTFPASPMWCPASAPRPPTP